MNDLLDEFPNASSYLDRHRKRRWRYRKGKKTVSLPGSPGEEVFRIAYAAALAGKPIPKAAVTRLPTATAPRSMRAAWRILISDTIEWQQLDPETQLAQTRIAERFLTSPVIDGQALTFGEMPIAELKRKHIKAILARKSDTPHAAAHLLRLIRKLTGVALEQEWIEYDPTYRLKYRPKYKGWKAWPADIRAKYEERWPIGTTPRLVYSIALYYGHRRSDICFLKWTEIEADAGTVTQSKTGKALWIPTMAELGLALAAAPRSGETVLLTQYGRPFSPKALGMRLQDWTKAAGIPPGYTLHGLRKTLGKMLAEAGCTTKQIMAILGHDDIKHAELYTEEAEQRQLAADGMEKLKAGPKLTSIKGGKA